MTLLATCRRATATLLLVISPLALAHNNGVVTELHGAEQAALRKELGVDLPAAWRERASVWHGANGENSSQVVLIGLPELRSGVCSTTVDVFRRQQFDCVGGRCHGEPQRGHDRYVEVLPDDEVAPDACGRGADERDFVGIDGEFDPKAFKAIWHWLHDEAYMMAAADEPTVTQDPCLMTLWDMLRGDWRRRIDAIEMHLVDGSGPVVVRFGYCAGRDRRGSGPEIKFRLEAGVVNFLKIAPVDFD